MSPGLPPVSLRVRIVVLCPLVAILVACGGSSTDVGVMVPMATLEVAPGTGTVEIGQSLQLTATPKDANGNALIRPLLWSSSDRTVAAVDENGLVTGVSKGTAVITAVREGMGGTATVRVIEPGAYNCSVQSQIPEAECWALVALYDATNGPEWRYPTEWLASTTPCSWHDVTCASGSVTELTLGSNRLTGAIPPELGNLSNLRVLYLGSNQLTGPIPAELGNLTNLRELYVWGNQLTGPIPLELGNLSDLEWLSLGNNLITGTIPPELGNLSSLERMHLGANQLAGTIPPELGNLSNLREMTLSTTQLIGTILPELGNLSNLEALFLGASELTGSIPPELGNLSKLERLSLWSNHLTGPIPAEFGSLVGLKNLYLSENQLSGAIPLAVAQLGGQFAFSCDFRPGNDGLFFPDSDDFRAADLNGDGSICEVAVPPGGPAIDGPGGVWERRP
jgi:hypothetical protein